MRLARTTSDAILAQLLPEINGQTLREIPDFHGRMRLIRDFIEAVASEDP
jgi:hypothetical protein